MNPAERLNEIEERLKKATPSNGPFLTKATEDIAWLLERVKEKSRTITNEEISGMKSWLSLEGDWDGWNAWTREANLRHLLYSYEEKLKRVAKLEEALKKVLNAEEPLCYGVHDRKHCSNCDALESAQEALKEDE
jgi:FAD/FMN-containing dehydrogenase